MNTRSIRFKILVSYVLLVFLALSSVGVAIYLPLKNSFMDNLEKDMINQAYITRTAIAQELSESSFETLQQKIERISLETSSRISVILADGQVVGDTEVRLDQLENHKNRAEIIRAFEGGIGVEKRFSNSTKRDMLYVAIPVANQDQIFAVVRISYGIEFINDILRSYRQVLFSGLLASLLFASLISIRVSRSLTAPIEEISRDLDDIARGDLDKEVGTNVNNELGDLAVNINYMKETIKEKISEADQEKNRLENIIGTMASGVIFLDQKSRVIMLNDVAEAMLSLSLPLVKNKPVYEVLRNYSIVDYADKCIAEEKLLEHEITINSQGKELYVKASFAPVYKEGAISGVTILLTNLTEEIKLSKLKSDFVANASHELRTPLTSVKGYTETLLNGAMEDKELREKFIKIIDTEADRLIALVEDLMNLSKIESEKNSKYQEIVDLKRIAYAVHDSFGLLAAEKEISLMLNLDNKQNYFVKGHEERLKQVLVNFVDNAIKYTPSGGAVTIALNQDDHSAGFEVIDNGPGLHPDETGRVFERFYRVDKSRNKKSGGFGLGLSIAKNIVESLGGTIGVRSEPGKGSTFWAHLQKAN